MEECLIEVGVDGGVVRGAGGGSGKGGGGGGGGGGRRCKHECFQ